MASVRRRTLKLTIKRQDTALMHSWEFINHLVEAAVGLTFGELRERPTLCPTLSNFLTHSFGSCLHRCRRDTLRESALFWLKRDRGEVAVFLCRQHTVLRLGICYILCCVLFDSTPIELNLWRFRMLWQWQVNDTVALELQHLTWNFTIIGELCG